jgi:SagB-type dehydrogenase family enzyme
MIDTCEGVAAYHDATKHRLHAFALGPGYLDWATQPDPFRRYAGAPLVPLHRPAASDGPGFDEAMRVGRVVPARLDARSVSRLFFHSLALSAWKQAGQARWALRVNPSSGNLHPTEGYLVCDAIEGLLDMPAVLHYAPKEHSLEVRARFDAATWRALVKELPSGTVLVGLTSIHWREAWKYGERAYRYCQHDVGHAVAAVGIAASGLGWQTTLLDGLGSEEIAALLGVTDSQGSEREHPDCLLAIHPPSTMPYPRRIDRQAIERIADLGWEGVPNMLSPAHLDWPIIDAVAAEASKPAALVDVERLEGAFTSRDAARPISLGRIVHQRRSAVAFDGHTSMSRDAFYRILERTIASPEQAGLAALWWRPRVHLALFVHRVEGLAPGLYLLPRTAGAAARLREVLTKEFVWERPEGCPPALDLWRLATADARRVARQVSCGQDIAADGCFSLGMVAEFEEPNAQFGPWFYPRLFWETGVVGQLLYLEAEAAGLRATGIGCFFDDAVHEVFGFNGSEFQSLYHFTVGMPVEDMRLTTLPPYPDSGFSEAAPPPHRGTQ